MFLIKKSIFISIFENNLFNLIFNESQQRFDSDLATFWGKRIKIFTKNFKLRKASLKWIKNQRIIQKQKQRLKGQAKQILRRNEKFQKFI